MHRAGQKIRLWRERQSPPLTAEQFGLRYGEPEPWPSRTVYGWEAKGKIARAGVQKRLAALGICEPGDWLEPVAGQPHTEEDRRMGATHPFHDIHTHGMVRVAAATPLLRPADVAYNAQGIIEQARTAAGRQADLVVFPELSLSAYAIDDLHLQVALLDAVEAQLAVVCEATRELATVLVIGLPLRRNGRVYNCAAVLCRGEVLGVVPKSFLPNYREYYEKRWFAHGRHAIGQTIAVGGREVPFGTDLLFAHPRIAGFVVGIEICEDIWAPTPPSTRAALAGATVILNLSASNITIGKSDERHLLCRSQSSRAACAYVYSASGHGESTTDLAWDGQGMIYELGDLLAESARFDLKPDLCLADVDCQRIVSDRLRMGTFNDGAEADGHPENRYRRITFDHRPAAGDKGLIRAVRRFPFVPNRREKLDEDCYEAFNIQVSGLIRRIEATRPKSLVIGISGGLDSTHALIVAAKACDALGLPRTTIRGYTMPGFATSEGTKSNAWRLMEAMGITAEEIDIRPTARLMLENIGHAFADGEPVYDVTFENVQAGLRTDYLFRLSGQHGGWVVGTGDLSELALGWCTYGVGDHMSHYNVNGGVPKTLIQYLIRWTATTGQFDDATAEVLLSVLDTEISPELVPAGADGAIQSTEGTIGPYALNDFFLHHIARWGQKPSHVAFLAWHAWREVSEGHWPDGFPEERKTAYDLATIRHWLEKFLVRFFQFSQFKRSAVPNGPKVSAGGALSPRGDWRAPSDAVAEVWLAELRDNLPPA